MFHVKHLKNENKNLSNGEEIEWVEVSSLDELWQTERGCGGFGSTGK